jgi:hypothetical protein
MEWYRQVQFVSAVPMPPELVVEYGTTVNGMWAAPEMSSVDTVEETHRSGRRALFSVPMIALTPSVYEEPGTTDLLEEVCRDVQGGAAECDWYYWESKPVYSICIYSDRFRTYLMERCRAGVDVGMDVVNLDEIMTSVGLMNLDPRGSGFCARCLERFRAALPGDDPLRTEDDEALRRQLERGGRLYQRYRAFHEREAFEVMIGFITDLRSYAGERNSGFAISANVGYLGNLVGRFGVLWGCLWGPHLDFILMENDYRVESGGPHLVLPRGSFLAWYRLGGAITGAPTWICPSINVPRQLAGQERLRYHELMFLEAYANGGRWGYYWWPGVDVEARRAATAPDVLKEHIRFIRENHDLYERPGAPNEVAIVYAEGPILRRPDGHVRYLALAQTLAEAGCQFDVVFVGDGAFNPEALTPEQLESYHTVLLPEAEGLGEGPAAALRAFAQRGGTVVAYTDPPLDPSLARRVDGDLLTDVWRHYREDDRARVIASADLPASAMVDRSEPGIGVVRSIQDGRQVFHLLNYRYDEATDTVSPVKDLEVRIPWSTPDASCTLRSLAGEVPLTSRVEDGTLFVVVPSVNPYAVLVASTSEHPPPHRRDRRVRTFPHSPGGRRGRRMDRSPGRP